MSLYGEDSEVFEVVFFYFPDFYFSMKLHANRVASFDFLLISTKCGKIYVCEMANDYLANVHGHSFQLLKYILYPLIINPATKSEPESIKFWLSGSN